MIFILSYKNLLNIILQKKFNTLEYSSIYSGSWIPKLGLLITEKGNVSGPIGVAKLYFCC